MFVRFKIWAPKMSPSALYGDSRSSIYIYIAPILGVHGLNHRMFVQERQFLNSAGAGEVPPSLGFGGFRGFRDKSL